MPAACDAKVMDRLIRDDETVASGSPVVVFVVAAVRNLLTGPALVSGLRSALARGRSYWNENAKARDRVCPACRHALADRL
jgi:hypothetical protein